MRIGIIGGGQLGMMMSFEAIQLDHTIYSYDINSDVPIQKYTQNHTVASYTDKAKLLAFQTQVDVLTYEFENLPDVIFALDESKFPQKFKALKIAQDRLLEKSFACSLGIPTPAYQAFSPNINMSYPCLIKTCKGGYDGKGQKVLHSFQDLQDYPIEKEKTYILEEFIRLDYEISVIASRDFTGKIVTYPISKNHHVNGILDLSIIGENIPTSIHEQAILYTKRIITELDYVGTLCVEYFVKGENLYFNEFAPRPHNSGHYSIEGCLVSQFQNHILAITSQEVKEPTLLSPCVMKNVLGKDISLFHKYQNKPGYYIHDYGKKEIINLRKMGHITILLNQITNEKETSFWMGESDE